MSDLTDRTPEHRSDAYDGGHLHATAPVATAEPEQGSAFRRRERRGVVPLVAVAVVAALIGGAAGTGITLATADRGSGAVTTSAANGSGSGIVINNPSTATAVAAVAAKAAPSVVTVSVSDSQESGVGSGIVLSANGDVLTNNHVVTLGGQSSSGKISVTTSNGRVYAAKVVGTDPLNDLAVIRLTGASGLTPASFGDSSKLNVGDAVVAIGAPRNLANTVTSGIVSALNRGIPVQSSAVPQGQDSQQNQQQDQNSPFNFWNFGSGQQTQQTAPNIYLTTIQTDAAINPGNSGGALLNGEGQVIGVNVAIIGSGSSESSSGSVGLGFAIPSVVAKRIADQLIAGKQPTHGQIGVESSSDTTAVSGGQEGVAVSKLTAGGAAAKAGIKTGDVITSVDGVAVTSFDDLAAQVRAHAGGATVQIGLIRDGSARTLPVTLGSITAKS